MAKTEAEKILKLMQKYGGSPTDIWAVGQPGSGFVRFDGSFVHIQHSGVLSRMTVGKGAKRIPVHQLTAIQIKPAGAIMSGYIQFTIAGAVERRAEFARQSFDAASDENSIMFTKDEQPAFERLRDAVESAIAARHAPPQAAPNAPAIDIADQLGKLAALRDQGILNDDEFAIQKARLLA